MKQPWLQLLATGALVACAPAMGVNSDGGTSNDSGAPVCMYPRGPYGNAVGTTVQNYTFQTCDGDDYAIGGPDHCVAKVTFLSVAAGW